MQEEIDEAKLKLGFARYGVTGIGQQAPALTRLYDAIGMVAQVGTDGDNSNVRNDFDTALPFARRKCVGYWELVNGRSKFHVSAYLGDSTYTEDGSMGDYVAVECPRCYYYFDEESGTLIISAMKYEGYRAFDIFCRDHNQGDTMEYYYAPAYALGIKDGHAVSLPGLDNEQGSFSTLTATARTYDGEAKANAILYPMAYNFYEWALFTVEFATQNCQSVMQGCAGLRHSNDDRIVLMEDGSWIIKNNIASRVDGEYISIQPTNVDINTYNYKASHIIKSIKRCDTEGNVSSSGTCQLVETEDLGLGREYVVGTEYRIAARPWRTGACNGVSTPSGSPKSNTNAYYPCKYRWHENPYSNQYMTVADLFNMRVGTGDSNYSLEWYFSPDPTLITGDPSTTDLATDKFELLDITTEHENYANGYVKSKKYSKKHRDLWIPYVTTWASTTTYFCDYAYLIYSHAVRSVRLGGYWTAGGYDGFSYALASNTPSFAFAYFGSALFLSKQG